MVKFERRDPFPHLNLGSFSKLAALDHAEEADRDLGLRVEMIEATLSSKGSRAPAPVSSGDHQNLWFGLEPRDLQTPYLEIRALLESVLPVGRQLEVVDLGCAYARMAFVIERHFPLVSFQGFEYVGERVNEARRVLEIAGAKRSRVDHADLTSKDFRLPRADVYFVYDYGTPAAIEKTLHDLKRVSSGRPLMIVARGRVVRYAIESRHPWLSRFEPNAPERAFTIYRSRNEVEASV